MICANRPSPNKDVSKLLKYLQSDDERYFYVTFTITV